jgi:hypothetical protein
MLDHASQGQHGPRLADGQPELVIRKASRAEVDQIADRINAAQPLS